MNRSLIMILTDDNGEELRHVDIRISHEVLVSYKGNRGELLNRAYLKLAEQLAQQLCSARPIEPFGGEAWQL